ncbi:MAG TPA: ornithine cyclodeaminase family protein [Actinomycetota bacterium]|nr:ornithine cyclodeaminase family protein [Actinomycetota bacterium]
MTSVRILREPDVRTALPMAACIEAMEAAFVAFSAGRAELPAVIHLDVPEAQGEIHVKAGHIHGAPAYAVKVASGFYAADPPAIDGLVLVFDAATGAPVAFLLDGGYLTDTRTGAAGGVAARWLAPGRVATVAVVGTGIQARRQVEALRCVRPEIGEVRIWGRSMDRAARAAHDIGAMVSDTVEEAVADADVVITCTASREPLVRAEWIAPGTHITAVGSDGAGKQELDPALLRRADVVAVDSLDQCLRLGELQHSPDQVDRAVELGRICARDVAGRASDEQLTICDLTGVGVQDVAAANAVLANAPAHVGETLEL